MPLDFLSFIHCPFFLFLFERIFIMLGLAGSLLGSVASGVLGLFGQKSANEKAENLSEKQMRFQADMSNTAFQRSSADMTKAGLNPAMMFGSAGAASTPPGAQAPVGNTMQAPAAALKDAASSATQQLIAQKTIDQLTSQIAKQNAEKANIAAALPGISADAGRKDMEYGDIKKIPPAIRIPIVQSGYGIDKLRGAGQAAAIGGGVAASAKSAAGAARDTLRPLGGLSGPSVGSAKAVGRALKEKFESFPSYSPAEREAARLRNAKRWGWFTGDNARGSVQYQQ